MCVAYIVVLPFRHIDSTSCNIKISIGKESNSRQKYRDWHLRKSSPNILMFLLISISLGHFLGHPVLLPFLRILLLTGHCQHFLCQFGVILIFFWTFYWFYLIHWLENDKTIMSIGLILISSIQSLIPWTQGRANIGHKQTLHFTSIIFDAFTFPIQRGIVGSLSWPINHSFLLDKLQGVPKISNRLLEWFCS